MRARPLLTLAASTTFCAVLLVAAACDPKLEFPQNTQLSCSAQGDCPTPLLCAVEAGLCLAPDSPCLLRGTSNLSEEGTNCAQGQICVVGRCVSRGCGDGFLDLRAGEECDDGPNNSDTNSNACRTTCKIAVCGDGIVDRDTESCDDGRADCVRCAGFCAVGAVDENGNPDDGCEAANFAQTFGPPGFSLVTVTADGSTFYGGDGSGVFSFDKLGQQTPYAPLDNTAFQFVHSVAAHAGSVVALVTDFQSQTFYGPVVKDQQITLVSARATELVVGPDGFYFINDTALLRAPFDDPFVPETFVSFGGDHLAACDDVVAWSSSSNGKLHLVDRLSRTELPISEVHGAEALGCLAGRVIVALALPSGELALSSFSRDGGRLDLVTLPAFYDQGFDIQSSMVSVREGLLLLRTGSEGPVDSTRSQAFVLGPAGSLRMIAYVDGQLGPAADNGDVAMAVLFPPSFSEQRSVVLPL